MKHSWALYSPLEASLRPRSTEPFWQLGSSQSASFGSENPDCMHCSVCQSCWKDWEHDEKLRPLPWWGSLSLRAAVLQTASEEQASSVAHLGTCWERRFLGLSPDPLNQSEHFNKPFWWCRCLLKFENCWSGGGLRQRAEISGWRRCGGNQGNFSEMDGSTWIRKDE